MVKENERYGKLTTIEKVGRTKYRAIIWKCICDCGNYTNVPSTSLTSGNTKSCGCLQKESIKKHGENNRSLNKYVFKEDYVIGYTSDNKEFYFDIDDYEKVEKYTWSINDQGYVISNPFGKPIRMHRLIMGLLDDNEDNNDNDVDHINHIKHDNKKSNLREIDHYKNITYSKTYSNNTSGRKVVYYDKSRNKWMAILTYNKKTYNLGRFDLFEDAVKAREEAEKNIHKEYHYNEKN